MPWLLALVVPHSVVGGNSIDIELIIFFFYIYRVIFCSPIIPQGGRARCPFEADLNIEIL